MSKLPYMPFFVSDYLSDTADLSLDAHGAYCLILFYTWKKKGWLEDDDKKMGRILRVHGTAWKRIKKEISPYFDLSEGVWFHSKIEEGFNRNGYKIGVKSLQNQDKIVVKSSQKNCNSLKTNKTSKNEKVQSNLIQSNKEDYQAKIYDEVLSWLGSTGKNMNGCRSFLARQLLVFSPEIIFDAYCNLKEQDFPYTKRENYLVSKCRQIQNLGHTGKPEGQEEWTKLKVDKRIREIAKTTDWEKAMEVQEGYNRNEKWAKDIVWKNQ